MWIPDDKEAYIEVEVKEIDGDQATVETKDGQVSYLLDRGVSCTMMELAVQWGS